MQPGLPMKWPGKKALLLPLFVMRLDPQYAATMRKYMNMSRKEQKHNYPALRYMWNQYKPRKGTENDNNT